MPRFLSRVWLVFAVVMILQPAVRGEQPGLGERLLPKATKGAVLVTNVEHLNKQWDQTQLGQLLADPVMEPFSKDLRRQFQERFSRVRQRLGLELDDLRGVPTGELDIAVIQPAKDQAVVAVLMDVKGHLPQARELLKRVTANMAKQGAKKTPYAVEGASVLLFDVPASEEDPAGQVVYFLLEEDSLLGAADNLQAAKDILNRHVGKGAAGDTLGDVAAYRKVMERCARHAGAGTPQIRWFVEPLAYMECVRTLTPEKDRRKGTTTIEIFRQQGFYAIQGVGGFVDFKVDDYEILHRTAVYAPRPYPKSTKPYYRDVVSMDMFTLPNSRDYALPPFIPNNVATCTMAHWDILKAFDNFGPTFDQLFGDEEDPAEKKSGTGKDAGTDAGKDEKESDVGVWQDVLDSLADEPDGPRIELRGELIEYLDRRVTAISDYVQPITTRSERLLFAVRIKPGETDNVTNSQRVADGLKKWFGEGDPTIRVRQYEGLTIFETVEPEPVPLPGAVNIQLPGHGYSGHEPKKGSSGRERIRGESDEEEEVLLPHRSVTVAGDHLLIASHYDFLIDILKRAKAADHDALGDSLDFQLVGQFMQKLGADEDCVRAFSRTDEEYRPTYELIRMGKMPEAETMFARMINSMFGPREKGVTRKQEIDGAKMPDYQVVRRSLGPAGSFCKSEADGWFFVGFMLKK